MRVLSTEQLLSIADEFCTAYPARVRSFAAIAAAAAVPGARVHGIPVHDTPQSAAAALSDVIRKLEPLSAHNQEFSAVCATVYQRLAAD